MSFPVVLSPVFIKKAESLGIYPADIEEQFIRGTGHGGQKINKTSSTVVLKHLKTGVEVRCQKHREQSKNRLSAYKLLILKIEEKIMGKESKLAKEKFKIRKQKLKRSKRAKEKILRDKKLHGEIKEMRADVKNAE